jgi:hypothetical protein
MGRVHLSRVGLSGGVHGEREYVPALRGRGACAGVCVDDVLELAVFMYCTRVVFSGDDAAVSVAD